MLKILWLFSVFNIVLCEIHINQASPCINPPLCYLLDIYKIESKSMFFPLIPLNSHNYGRQSNLQRNYYSGFDLSILPAYYSTIDPISVLASLAFLVFLLQSFALFFDRTRSILPIISGRQSSTNLIIPQISKHVSRALQEYKNLNKDSERK